MVKVEKGDLDGLLYLAGKPRFDPVTNYFFVEDLDFDLQSQSLLYQSANWLLHSTISESAILFQ